MAHDQQADVVIGQVDLSGRTSGIPMFTQLSDQEP